MSSPSDCPPWYRKAWTRYTREASPRSPHKQSDRLTDEDIPEKLDDVLDGIDMTEPPNLYSPDLSDNTNTDQGEHE